MKCLLAKRDNSAIRLCAVFLVIDFVVSAIFNTGNFLTYRSVFLCGLTGISLSVALIKRITVPKIRIEYDTGGIYINNRFGKTEFIPFSQIQDVCRHREDDMSIYVKPRRTIDFRKVGSFNRLTNGGKIRLSLNSGLMEIKYIANVNDVISELKNLLEVYRQNWLQED